MKTVIYLIRHSEQLKIKSEIHSHDSDQVKNEKIVLSVRGEEKAKEFSKKEELKKIDVVYASHYTRAIATAKYIAEENQLEINIDERLGERRLGDLQTLKEALKNCDGDPSTLQLIDENLKNASGESNLEVRARMAECIEELIQKHEGKTLAVISHGGAIRFLLMKWCQYNAETNSFSFQEQKIFQGQLETPSALKLIFEGKELIEVHQI